MSNDQLVTDNKEATHNNNDAVSKMDKKLLKKYAPLDLCYDLAIDSVFYRVINLVLP